MAYVYSITNQINDNKYVGKTSKPNPYDRWKEHIRNAQLKNLSDSLKTMAIIHAIRKYGAENFKFRVIEECTDDKINERETYWIDKLDTYNHGYNSTYGGEGIRKDSKDWGNHPASRAISCWTLDGVYVCDYDTCGVAALETIGSHTLSDANSIRQCIRGTCFQSHGYRWTYKGDKLKEWGKDKQIRIRSRIYGYHSITGEYKEWDSQADCAEYIEGNRKSNANVKVSLDSPRTAKCHCKKWWLFRFSDGKKVPFNRIKITEKNRGHEYYSKLGKMSASKSKKRIKGIAVGMSTEVVYFDSISEASFHIKGTGNYSAVSGISLNIKKNQPWCYSYGYKWSFV
mgnify:CR=1 FL=1